MIRVIAVVILAAQSLFAEAEPDMVLDFKSCTPGTQVAAFGLGSFTAQFVGQSRHGCVVLFGREIENPRWDHFLSTICVVPEKLGVQRYKVTNHGPDVSGLNSYCTRTPRPDAQIP